MTAVKNIIPSHLEDDITFTKDVLQGHHDNSIILFKAIVRKEPLMKDLIGYFFSKLEADDKKTLLSDVESRVDEKGNLYLRLDKQEAFQGNIRLGQTDPIHIRIRLHKKARENLHIIILSLSS
jgi:hypothetical protein